MSSVIQAIGAGHGGTQGTVPARGLDGGPGPVAGGGAGPRHTLCDQAAVGPAHAGPGARRQSTDGLGDGGHGPWLLPRAAQLAGGRGPASRAGGAAQRGAVGRHGRWRVDEVHAAYGDRERHRLSAGAGSKGERWYDWQC